MTNDAMLYFEFEEPYYALVIAPDQKRAVELYKEMVSEDAGTWKLIAEMDAIAKAAGKYKQEEFYEIDLDNDIRHFRDWNGGVLLIDGGLL